MLCQDFVYEQRLDGVINETRQELEIPRGMGALQIFTFDLVLEVFSDLLSTSHSFFQPSESKRKRQRITPFVPNAQEAALLARAGPPLSCRGSFASSPLVAQMEL